MWRPWMKVILGVVALLITYNAISRQAGATGWDFWAYYKAGTRVLSGSHPYIYEEDFPYKYGPAVVLPFLFFQLFSYDIARWVYCALHLVIALSIPFLNFKLLARRENFWNLRTSREYFWAILIGFAGTLRFLDGEFQTSQVSLWIYALMVLAVLAITSLRHRTKFWGFALLALISQVKIHSSVMWLALTRKLFVRRNLIFLVPAVLVFLIPNPLWWLEWARQIKETTPLLPTSMNSYNRQGFFSVAVMILRQPEYGPAPWLLSLPFALFAAWRLPRFEISALKRDEAPALLLSLMAWMLWGFMSSPLPWQHTYSLLWGLFPFVWMMSPGKTQRRWLLFVAMGLAISPKGILGIHLSSAFEFYQGPLALILVFWFVLVSSARRR